MSRTVNKGCLDRFQAFELEPHPLFLLEQIEKLDGLEIPC